MSVSEDDLLKMAQGIMTLDGKDISTEDIEIDKIKKDFSKRIGSQREMLQVRKTIRREVLAINFKIAGTEKLHENEQAANILERLLADNQFSTRQKAVISLINEQLDSNHALKWDNFTKSWDIHPTQQSRVILKEFWSRDGGQYDEIGSCYPIAFTNQEFD